MDFPIEQVAEYSEAWQFWFWVGFMALMGFIFLQGSVRNFWWARTIDDTPTAKIRSAAQGYVELNGHMRAHKEHFQGPLTGKTCIWYAFEIWERRGSGKHSKWVLVEHGVSPLPVRMDDGTGYVLIYPQGAEVICRSEDSWYGSERRPTSVGKKRSWVTGGYQYKEKRILEHEWGYALGHFETRQRGKKERDAIASSLLQQWKNSPIAMERFDTDGDGEISMAEWQAAIEKADSLAREAEKRREHGPKIPQLVATSESRYPFIISTKGETDLSRGFKKRAFWNSLGFIVIVCICGSMIYARYFSS